MSGNVALTIYYPLPKMNPKSVSHLVPLYSLEETSPLSIYHNSVRFFIKDNQELSHHHHQHQHQYQHQHQHQHQYHSSFSNAYSTTSKKYYFHPIKKKVPPFSTPISAQNTSATPLINLQEIEREWSKLSPLLQQLHLFHNPLSFLSSLPVHDSSWNFIHYFPLNISTAPSSANTYYPVTNVYSKYYTPTTGLFLMPNSFYLSTLQYADFIVSLYELSEEQIVYLTLFALLVQNPKGSFVLKLKYFYTPVIMDILYLLSCVYNKIILLPLDYVNFYVICKGFQMDFIRPHTAQIKRILNSLRENSLQRISTNKDGQSFRRIFSMPLPSLFVSKIEEINVLVHHKQLTCMND